ncbi:MAG: Bax inhibitor-1 family protein, partial [Pseudomonadota bacterium]
LFITLGVYFGLLWAVHQFRDRDFAILLVFALTGFLGYTIGPIIGFYLQANPNIVINALATTAAVFIGLSAYVVTTKKDFSFMGGFLVAGILAAFVAGLAAYFFNMPGLSLAVSYAFVMLMVGLILWETSRIVNGGETNYVLATVTLFVSIFNLFTSLMHIFGSDE